MSNNSSKGTLDDWRGKFPGLFEICEMERDGAPGPWDTAEAQAEGQDRELLKTLHQRLEASGGGVKLELTPAGARLDLDPAWASAHGEAALDITALVYGVGAAAVRRWLLPTEENVQ